MYCIRIDGVLKPVLITPKQLEDYIRQCRRNLVNDPLQLEHLSLEINHNNLLAIIYKLVNLYKVKYKLSKHIQNRVKVMKVKIPAMNIYEKAFGSNYNHHAARRALAYKIHRAYSKLIICRT